MQTFDQFLLATQSILLGLEFGAYSHVEQFLGIDLFLQASLGPAQFFLSFLGLGQIGRRLGASPTKFFQLGGLGSRLFLGFGLGFGGEFRAQTAHLGGQGLGFRPRTVPGLAGFFEFRFEFQLARRHGVVPRCRRRPTPALGLVQPLSQSRHFFVVPCQLARLFTQLFPDGLQVPGEFLILRPSLGGFPGGRTCAKIEKESRQHTQAGKNQSNGLSHNNLPFNTFFPRQASTR